MRTRRLARSLQRLQPLALASLLALGASGLNAAPRTFAGPGSFWDVVANWTGGILPGAGDDVLLGAFNTEVRTSFTINSFIGTGSLTVSAGTLSFAAASSIGSLIQTAGVIAGTGNLTVSGATVLNGGQMIGSGETLLNGALTMGNFASLALDEGRVLRIAGGATLSNNAFQFNPNSTGSAAAGRLVNELGSTLTDNSSSGSSFAANNFGGTENGASASFTNLGTYTKTGVGNTSIAVAFTNSGTLNVNAGTVTLSAGSTQGGNISTAAGATLNFSGGTHALNNAAGITNAGTLAISSGTVNLGGSLNSAGLLTLNGGTLNLGAGNHQAATFTQGSGVLTGTGSFTVSGAASLNGGQMVGSGDTVLDGAMSMGNFAGLGLDEGRTLRINAGATLSNNSLQLNPNSTGNATAGRIVNAAGSTLTDNSNSGSSFASNNFGGVESGASATFTNLGTYTKTGTGNTNIGVNFLNSGTLNVNGGTVTLSGGSTHTGGTLAGTGLLSFQGGVHNFDAASAISTANVNFSGGSVTVAGIYNVSGTTTFNSGTVSLPAVITSLGSALVVNGGTANLGSNNVSVNALTLGGGVLTGSGTLTVPAGGTATLNGGQMIGSGDTVINTSLAMGNFAGLALDEGRTLRINAGATLSNNSLQLNPNSTGNATAGRIVNAAGSTLTDNSNSGSSFASNNFGGVENGASASFNNLGTYTKTGTGNTTIGVNFLNSGTLNVNGGTVTMSGGGTHTGATLSGTGLLSFQGGVHNFDAASTISTANVNFSGGSVTVAGIYNVSGTTTFNSGTVSLPAVINSLGSALVVNGGTANLGSNNVSVNALTMGGGVLAGSGTVTVPAGGTVALNGGQMIGSGETVLNAPLAMANFAGFSLDEGRTLRISAGATLSNNSLQLNPNSTGNATAGRIVNAAGSTITDNGNSGSNFASNNFGGAESGASASFTNLGTYTKTGTGNTGISTSFINSGTLNVNGGSVVLSGGSTHGGAIQIAAGASLNLSSGTHSLDNAASISNAGTLLVSTGITNVAGNLNSGALLQLNGGTLNLAGGTHQAASFSQGGGTLSGSGDFTVTGAASFSGGLMIGPGQTILSGALSMSNFAGTAVDEGRTLRLNGGATLSNNSIQLNPTSTGNASAGRLVNAAGSTVIDNSSSGSSIASNNFGGVDNGASASFSNLGTYTKTNVGNTGISVSFSNSGTLNVDGGIVTLSGGSAHSGAINTGAAGTLSFSTGTHALGNAAAISNLGTLQFGGGTANVAGNLNSAGLVQISGGVLNLGGGTHQTASFSQLGGFLSGTGEFTVSGAASLGSSGQMLGTGTTVLAGVLTMPNFNSFSLDEGRTLRIAGGATLTNNSFQLNPNNTGNATAGRIVNAAGSTITDNSASGSNFGSNNFGGIDNGASASFTNLGTYAKTGSGSSSIDVNFINDGTVNAAGGTLVLNRGANGSGTLATAGTGTAVVGANSTLGTLRNNGSAASALNLQTFSVTVSGDYDNASFGSGNSFNRRANVGVSGAGARLIAAGDVNQALAGSGVSGGATAAPTLSFGNVHVGSTTRGYQIVNVGSSGPALRGAVQTTVGGANLSDGRLSGNGVTAANWGPVTAGGALAREVTLTVATTGVYAPLAGQAVNIVNNFDNTRSQLLTITSAAGAAAYNLAAAAAVAPNPVLLANQRVGMSLTGALTITNSAPAGSFTEGLNAAFGTLSGQVLSNGGSVALLAGGASNGSAMALGVDTSTAGSKSGTAQLLFASDGSGSSGLGLSALPAQTVSVSGDVYRLAQASAVTPNVINLGNLREGGIVTQALTLSNLAAADGVSERLNASIAGSPGIVTGGAVSLLAAGASSSALFAGVDTSSAGAKSGSATLTLFSDGSGTSGFSPFALGTQVVNVSATVYRLAQASLVTPATVTLADQRVGGSLAQALTLGNIAAADGFSEGLNGSITASGGATAAGSFTQLAAGASSNALSVGVNTASAGAQTGTALITLASDGTGTSGFAAFGLAGQTVTVAGNVFRLAVPVVDTTPLSLAARVGDATLAAGIGVSNNAPDLFTERLNASIASSPAGTSAGAALVGLAPNASGSLQLSLPTTTAGSFSGTVGVALVSSSAGTTSGAPDFALGAVNVAFNGRVYAPAVAQLPLTVVDFGTVRVGDVVAARNVAIANTASGALTDTLQASISGGPAPFSSSGSVAGLAAGASNSSALMVQLATATAGVFSGTATVQLRSQNPDLPELTLPGVDVQLQGQVNNIASAALAQAGGSGSFSGTAFSYTLDFGTVVVGTGTLTGTLNLANAASGTADALAGSWSLAALAGGPFSVAGFDAFTGLAAGSQLAGLTVSFNVATEGEFSRTVVLNGLSTNGSGPDLTLNPITLQLQGTVVAVPEPGTYLMMAVGVLAMGSIARRRLRAQRG